MPLKGDAGFKYTPPGSSETTVPLNAPLLRLSPLHVGRRWVRESLDLSVRDVTKIGDGVHEILAMIRFIDDPQGVLTMLRHAADGVELEYFPSLSGGTGYRCLLIHDGEIELEPDANRYAHGEWQIAVRLRRSSGTWEGVL